jgi:N-acetylated-alpha-linked acidic dipeptidase
MRRLFVLFILCSGLAVVAQNPSAPTTQPPAPQASGPIFGFRNADGQRNSDAERQLEQRFIAVPDPKLAEEHLRILTSAPHIAGSPEDRATADYVAAKFRAAGLQTEIREFKVWLDRPAEISVELVAPAGMNMRGPSREHVDGDPFQDDPRIPLAFNAYSASGDAEAEVVYGNYGRPADIQRLKEMGISLRGKILLVRYGQNFRGVKAEVAQDEGAAGVLIYSDPIDDGYFRGDAYPRGPWRPATGVQRGSIQYSFIYPGDPTTPGVASSPELPNSRRVPADRASDLPRVICVPLSYHDAEPILLALAGPESPRDWQGALPFTYHLGPGPGRVRMHVKQTGAFYTIWDVIGRIPGTQLPNDVIVAGNHRDAWVYGAVDPNSGTAAMLEAVHGVGELLKSGWRPRRTVIFASWDAEEQGLIGSTEWVEQNESLLRRAALYLNMDTGASGPNFRASAVGSLKQFIRDVTKDMPSPKGGSVYDAWNSSTPAAPSAPLRSMPAEIAPRARGESGASPTPATTAVTPASLTAPVTRIPAVSALGSGSDYSPFVDHLGVPAADVRSAGDYGVYHSAFDNFAWYKKFGDPEFIYTQQMARVFGAIVLRMAQSDVLPYDYETYGRDIVDYLETAQKRSEAGFGSKGPNFAPALAAARRLSDAGSAISHVQQTALDGTGMAGTSAAPAKIAALNSALLAAERALLLPAGLPNRPWFRHAIYAPGQYTGYEAVVIPGVNEAVERKDVAGTQQQLEALAGVLNSAAAVLENAAKP